MGSTTGFADGKRLWERQLPQESFEVGCILASGVEADVEVSGGEPLLELLERTLQLLISFAGLGKGESRDRRL